MTYTTLKQRFPASLRGVFLLMLIGIAFPLSVLGQETSCAHGNIQWTQSQMQAMLSSQAEVPTSGQFRALIVFVRFKDDTFNDTCNDKWLAWHTSDMLPDMAHDFLAPGGAGGQAPSPPFPEDSITEYFYQQSDRSFIFYGEPYDEVVETQFNESHYQITGTGSTSQNGMAELTEEVLDYIDAQGFDFSEYDNDGPDGVPDSIDDDGYIDHIFIIPRRFQQQVSWAGFSILGNPNQPILSYDGKDVDWNLSGSYNRYGNAGNIIPLLTLGRLMAHEFGHDIWGTSNIGGVHLQAITSNDVPSNGTKRIAYAHMPGRGGALDMAGNETISAFERDVIGWINCIPLQSDASGVRLDHLYSSGDCRVIELDNSSSGKTIYLSNLQHVDYFDELHIYDPSCFYAEDGLKTTGLLVGISQGSGSSAEYDELPADNTLDISNAAGTYAGDLYSPSTSVQITPWTRPNINGCTGYTSDPDCDASNFTPSWQAVDNIRYVSGSSGPVEFDYIADFRAAPIIREDSWIGAETSGETITGDLIVEAGATLTIEPGTTLKFASGKGIIVYGTLDAEDVTLTASGTSWDGITLSGSSASASIHNSTISKATTGLYVQSASGIPTVTGSTITNSGSYAIHVNSGSVDVYDSQLTNSGSHGVYVQGGDITLTNSTVSGNGGSGVRLAYGVSGLRLGCCGDNGYNVLTGNGSHGVYANASSLTLGIAPSVVLPDGYAGYNSIYANTGKDMYLTNGSDVRAEQHWWGESPPSTSDFHISGTSTLDYTPYLVPCQGSSAG